MSIQDNTALRRTLLFGVPAVYLVLMSLHPTENPVRGDDVGFWMVIHVVQLVLIGGLSCIILVLTAGNTGRAARIARGFILPYAITYAAFDAMAGIAWGSLIEISNDLDAADQAAADRIIDQMGATEPAGVVFYIIVGLCWLMAMGAAVVSLRGRAPTGALVLLGLGTVVFALGHPRPVGPVGMSLFLIGMVWLELRPRHPQPETVVERNEALTGPSRAT